MSIKLVCFLGTLPLLILWPARSQAAEPAAATIKSEKNHLDFVVGDDLVGRYQFGKDAAKPYFWPLHGPGGVIITRGWPMEKAPEGGSMSDQIPKTRREGFYWVVLGQNPPEIAYWDRAEWWRVGDPKPWQPEAVTVASERLVFTPRLTPVA